MINKINGIKDILESRGDYIVLGDYGQEGLSILTQAKSANDAINWISKYAAAVPVSLVKLVSLEIYDIDSTK